MSKLIKFDIKEGYKWTPKGHEHARFIVDAVRTDDTDSIYLARQLQRQLGKFTAERYTKIMGREMLPTNTSVESWAETYAFEQMKDSGVAEIIAKYATDVPFVETADEEIIQRLATIKLGAKWSDEELMASQANGKALNMRYATAAVRGIRRLENGIIFTGSDEHSLLGIFSAGQNIPTAALPNGTWVVTTQADRENIIEDMNSVPNTIVEQTGLAEIPESMGLPLSDYNLIASTTFGVDNGESILERFLRNSKYVKEVFPSVELETAASGSPAILCYTRDTEAMEIINAQDLRQGRPFVKHGVTEVVWSLRTGGVAVYRPGSARIATGL